MNDFNIYMYQTAYLSKELVQTYSTTEKTFKFKKLLEKHMYPSPSHPFLPVGTANFWYLIIDGIFNLNQYN